MKQIHYVVSKTRSGGVFIRKFEDNFKGACAWNRRCQRNRFIDKTEIRENDPEGPVIL